MKQGDHQDRRTSSREKGELWEAGLVRGAETVLGLCTVSPEEPLKGGMLR